MGKKEIVMIIEDDRSVRYLLEQTLLCEDYEVVAASNGGEALAILAHTHPALIVTDIKMKPVGGREFIQKIQASPALLDIPVIVMSAETNLDGITGVAAILPKPFRPDVLLHAVHACLR